MRTIKLFIYRLYINRKYALYWVNFSTTSSFLDDGITTLNKEIDALNINSCMYEYNAQFYGEDIDHL